MIREFMPTGSWRCKILKFQGVNIGKDVFIGKGVIIDRVVPHLISIGDNTVIADRVIILTHDASPNKRGRQPKVGPIEIESNVFIGVNCVILPGVTIGTGSIIGAGSIINENVPSYVMAAGNPAKIKTDYGKCEV
ncbi:MAG: DapH/DapD/GlmU-related protein [Methanosarcina sp.]